MKAALTAFLLLFGIGASADMYFWRGASFDDYGNLSNWTNETGSVSRLPGADDTFYAYENHYFNLNGVRTIGGWDSASHGNWSRYYLSLTNGVLNVAGTVKNHSDAITVLAGATLDFLPSSRYEIAYNDSGAHRVYVRSGGRLCLRNDTRIYKLELEVDAGGVLDLIPARLGIYENTAQVSYILNRGEMNVTNGLTLASGSKNSGQKFTLRQAGGRMTLSGKLSDGGVTGNNAFVWEGGAIEVLEGGVIDFAQASVAAQTDVTLRIASSALFDFGTLTFGEGSRVTVTGGGRLCPPQNRPAELRIDEGALLIERPGVYDLTGITFGEHGRLQVAKGLSAVQEGDRLVAETLPIGSVSAGARTYRPQDGRAEIRNPACGYAGGWWTGLKNDGSVVEENLSGNCSKLWCLNKFSKGYLYNNDYANYTNHVQNFVGGADIPLNEGALLSISNTLLSVRRNGGSVVTRIAYTWDGYGGCECDDFEMVLTHIRQVARIYNCFTDVVAAVECGVIGAYGEMHTSRYTGAEYANRIIDTWLTSMDSSIPLLLRGPNYLLGYIGETASDVIDNASALSSEKQAKLDRLGFYNDGYLGTWWDYGTWGAMTREQGCAYLRTRPHLPYGGEFATVTADFFNGSYNAWKLFDPKEYNLVREWYDTHLNYLRTIESTGMTVYQEMAKRTFRVADYRYEGMPGLDEYDGVDLRTFCRDHMGARFVVREARLESSDRLTLEIENTGFSSPRFPLAAQVLFVARNDAGGGESLIVPATASADYPAAGQKKTMTFAFSRPEGLYLSGNWFLAIRLYAPLADESANPELPRRPFRFANDPGQFATGDGSLFLFRLNLRAVGESSGMMLTVF